jgi:hypothetical protein
MELAPHVPQAGMVLCADCGVPIVPSSANLCLSCLRNSVDITEGIPKQATINFCRNCERYLNPPQSWVTCQLESRELLAICLKKLKGLNKVRLIDAGFVWTEPHSKRLRVKLTVQKEVSPAKRCSGVTPGWDCGAQQRSDRQAHGRAGTETSVDACASAGPLLPLGMEAWLRDC